MPEDLIEEKLEAYIDGQLSPEEMAQVQRLLASNWRYRKAVEQMQLARRWVATLPRVRAPADLLESIDPSLERAALFDEAHSGRASRFLLSPQLLALAATLVLAGTLVGAMLWLMPPRDPGSIAVEPEPRIEPPVIAHGTEPRDQVGDQGDEQNVAQNDQPDQGAVEQPMPDRDEVADAGNAVAPRPDVPADGMPSTAGTDEPRQTVLPQSVSRAMLLSASVADIPQAAGAVSQFLTAADLPVSAQQVVVSDLPPEVQKRLNVTDGSAVQVFLVEGLTLEQIGRLTSQLAAGGSARAVAPAELVAEHRPASPDPVLQADQEQRVYGEDQLQVLVQRQDEPPEQSPPGVPDIDKQQLIEVEVTQDGYADFGKLGLGRIDVLGKAPDEIASAIRERLGTDFEISAEVQIGIASRGAPQGGHSPRGLVLTYLDREPLKTGDLVQIDLLDGAWLQTIVDSDGMIDTGELGQLEAGGKSAAQLQERLRALALARAAEQAQQDGVPLTTDQAPRGLRVVNLSARRAQGVDSFAGTRVECLIVLSTPEPDSEVSPPEAPSTLPLDPPE